MRDVQAREDCSIVHRPADAGPLAWYVDIHFPNKFHAASVIESTPVLIVGSGMG